MLKKLIDASKAFIDVLFDNPAKQERKAEEAKRQAERVRRWEEEVRKAEEERRREEAEHKAQEARRLAEAERSAQEAKRRAEETRKQAEAERSAQEAKRLAEEQRQAEEAKRREEERKAEKARLRAEKKRKAEEAKRLAEAERKAEEDRIKQEISEKTRITPTENQWQMILTQSTNTYVVAGAGSGKSTSLVLRVLVLHHYRNIPLHHITVFSFTRKSTQDFRQKLQKVFRAFDYSISDEVAQQVVRTFHSKILELTRGVFSESQLFEFLTAGHDLNPTNNDFGLADSSLNDTQEQYLKSIYQNLFQSNQEFRECILDLYRRYLQQITLQKMLLGFKLTGQAFEELRNEGIPENVLEKLQPLAHVEVKNREEFLMAVKAKIGDLLTIEYEESLLKAANIGEDEKEQYTEYVINIASQRDLAVTQAVNTLFTPPASAIAAKPIRLSGIYNKYEFHTNAYLPGLDCYLVYIPQQAILGDLKNQKFGRFPLAGCLAVKQKILLRMAEENIIFIHTTQDMSIIAEQARWFQQTSGNVAPSFPYAPDGEFITPPIWLSFYSTAQFIESTGIEVHDLKTAVDAPGLPPYDQIYLRALLFFWAAFIGKLKEDRIKRFHDLFAFFSEHQPDNFQKLSRHALESMSHILIDEFQDISPEVVYWIRGVVNRQRTVEISSSLMCVGDDWQSIYGWRGSSPHYFINYHHEFPLDNPYRIEMTENFRSNQGIINDAETILRHVNYKTDKHGVAVGNNHRTPVQMFRLKEKSEILPLLHTLLQQEGKDNLQKLMILSRSNDMLNQIQKSIEQKFQVKLLTTLHQSKGLEADICIMVGDCGYNSTIPLKNLVYAKAGFKQTYDAAQFDEARRLAYVGITRACEKCYWLAVPQLDGAFELLAPPEPKEDKRTTMQSSSYPTSRFSR